MRSFNTNNMMMDMMYMCSMCMIMRARKQSAPGFISD